MRLCVISLLLLFPLAPARAQQAGSRFTIGVHGGADVGGNHTIKLLGGELGFRLTRGIRVVGAGTSSIDEPGSLWFAFASIQLHLTRGPVRPYLGVGGSLENISIGPFSKTTVGWLAQGGLAVPIAGGIPFVEVRLLGVSDTRTQLLVGFRAEAR